MDRSPGLHSRGEVNVLNFAIRLLFQQHMLFQISRCARIRYAPICYAPLCLF